MRFSRLIQVLGPTAVVLTVVALVLGAARSPKHPLPPLPDEVTDQQTQPTIQQVDQVLSALWAEQGVEPAAAAEELLVLRRLSLALHGSVPSLEEIRRFEADAAPQRLERWTWQMLADRRFADYFSVRLARSFVGAEDGQFILFRRDRFTNWLADQIHEDRPLDELVRAMISENGLWTGVPATNYITQAAADGNLDVNKLAGRTVRAFLGQRIDCAQCHNHPFADWKQGQFEGLAACFGEARISPAGISDDPSRHFTVTDRMTLQDRQPAPAVPFGEEWWPKEGSLRTRLAAWVTHPENTRFERAIVNRTWGLVFGRPWSSPVDDLPDPPQELSATDLLTVLGRDFREHHCDLKRLVFLITTSHAFRISSQHPAYDTGENLAAVESTWAAFPLVRLRPEQMIGAMCQSASIKTIDRNSHLLTRILRFAREQDFVREFGDFGEQELEERSGTIPQALLRMNGRFAREIATAAPLTATGRIAGMAHSAEGAVETAFLCCVTRRPTPEELACFAVEKNSPLESRADMLEDVYWTLFNSPEFCWNH